MKRLLCLIALLGGLSGPAQAAPAPWPAAPYSFYAEDRDLRDVLREFAGGFSLSLQLGARLNGVVNGRFTTANPTEFLDRLGGVYGFNWFVHAGTLFVSRSSDMVTRSISVPGGSVPALRDALTQLGVLDRRFGWGELPEQDIALVSGPPAYVDLIQRTVAELPLAAGRQEVAIFRLRHAAVNDRTVRYRDTEVVTPGLATVLRNLIAGTGANDETLSAIAAPLRNNAPMFEDVTVDESLEGVDYSPQPAAGNGGGSGGGAVGGGRRALAPTVQADTRLNAIIVQDIPERIPVYRRLIEQLDVPSTLIEIEAMIVDVNSEVVNELGVTWGGVAGNVSMGYGNLGLSPTGLPLGAGTAVTPGLIGLSVGNSLVARLRALQGTGDAQILSQPSILTVDNLGAMIDLSETFYIQTRGERVATVTPVTVGTSLRVTPRHIRDSATRDVELVVDIEDGRIQDELQIDNLPTVRKSNISTLAIVSDEDTLLIGGYSTSHDSSRVDKVPFLGDIPVLGTLFSSRSSTVQRRERLFLIRPRLVAIDGVRVEPPTPEQMAVDAPDALGIFIEHIELQRARMPALLPSGQRSRLPGSDEPTTLRPQRTSIRPASASTTRAVERAGSPLDLEGRDWDAEWYRRP